MRRIITNLPSIRISHPVPPHFAGLLGRLGGFALLAVLGCDTGKDEPLGIVGADEMGAEQMQGAEEAGADGGMEEGLTPDDQLAGPDPIVVECAGRASCACDPDRFADAASCEEFYRVEWAAIEGAAVEGELIADYACYTAAMPYANYGCDSYYEYAQQPGEFTCSFCQYAHGDRQEGETCQNFLPGTSDCDQGLMCNPTGDGEQWTCIDPCGQAELGEPCNYLACADGLACDWNDYRCHEAGGAGELCVDGICDEGLQCEWNSYTCLPGVGVGDSCAAAPCEEGLACGVDATCIPLAGPGESCAGTPCVAGLACTWDTMICAAPGGEGEGCSNIDCAQGLFCEWPGQTCESPGEVGESCEFRPCDDGLQCNYASLICEPPPGLGEPCFDWCADGLQCNYDLAQPVCAELPLEGEPCLLGSCAMGLVCEGESMLCIPEPPMLCWL